MSATNNPITGLAAYLGTITQIYEATAVARFLRSVEQFTLKDITAYLEKGRCSGRMLAERFTQLPEASEFDVLLLAADLNTLALGALRKLCKSESLDNQGAKAALIGRLNGAILEKAKTVTELPADATDILLEAAASDEARSAAARAISIGLRGFGSLMGKTALQQVKRLTFSLHFAARSGGIESYVSESQSETAGTLIDFWRQISSHKQGRPLNDDLFAIIKKSTVGNLKAVLRLKDLSATGNKGALVQRLADSLGGTAAAPAVTVPGKASSEKNELFQIEQQAREAEKQYLALLQSVRTASLGKIENDFAALKSRPSAVILALGKLRGYSESSASRLLSRFWNNIELAAATVQRSDLRK